ncbi:MAG: PHP domain-containing protein, partial [Candidatus Aureabacteria bacterium]|nr:PHP domain-containing protein [Candidatus Auribacterota bacterium]
MEKEFADLHVHTIYSDGTFPPEAIIAEAAKCGLKIISLTDHDTADVYLAEGIQSVSSRYGVEIIPGVEFSADYYMQSRHLIEVHVIGYFIDIFDQKLKDYFREYQEMRYLRAQAILKKLNAMNIPLQMQDLKKEVKK